MQTTHEAKYQKNKQSNQNWAEGLNRQFYKDIQVGNKT